jgi:hypothetical protein
MTGMSDNELEELCKDKFWNNGWVPWMFWTSETYSSGKYYRNWLNFPKFLPLPFASDHGIDFGGKLKGISFGSGDEKCSMYLTWGKRISQEISFHDGIEVIPCPSPWAIMLKRYQKEKNLETHGKIICYIPHSTESEDINFELVDDFVKQCVSKNNNELENLVLCVQMHDIRKGLHKYLRKYEIPIITNGNSNDTKYLLRVLRNLQQSKRNYSAFIGTQILYSISLGVPMHILLPEKYVYPNLEEQKFTELFIDEYSKISIEQQTIVNRYLGTDCFEIKRYVRRRVYKLLIKNFSLYFSTIKDYFFRKSNKLLDNLPQKDVSEDV